jgi:peptide/nickel transport system permease protein
MANANVITDSEELLDSSLSNRKKTPLLKRSMSINIGVLLVAIMLVFAIFPNLIATHSPTDLNFKDMLQAPSSAHYFGTDNFGRDIFSRVVHSTRIDLTIGVIATIVPLIVGTILGLLAGYYGKWIDTLLMRILDIFMAFPFMVLVIAIVAVLGPGIRNVYIAIWIVGWKYYARLVRSKVLVIKNSEYVQAAKVLGYSDARIILRHILPNAISSAIVFAASDVVMCMLAAASLSFLGLGVQPPTPEWGSIIADGRAYISTAWWITAFPGLFLVVAGTGFSLIGDGLSDLIRTKGR